MGRLGNTEKSRARNLKINPNYIVKSKADPSVPRIIVDNYRHNNPWDPKVEARNKHMNRTYHKARRIYETGDTNYEKISPSSPISGKRKRS